MTATMTYPLCRNGLHPMIPGNVYAGGCRGCRAAGSVHRRDRRAARMWQLLTGFAYDPAPGWESRGRCRGANAEMFDPADAEDTGNSRTVGARNAQRHEEAREWCLACPVVAECLGHALTYRRQGTWGGELLTKEDWDAAAGMKERLEL